MKRVCAALAFVLMAGFATSGQAVEWGNLSGTFIYDGVAPKPEALVITKDMEVCGKYQDEIVDQSLLVGEKGGISGVFVWLKVASGKKVEIHPDFEKDIEKNPAVVDNIHCMFQPHTIGVWAKKQTFLCKNSDPIAQVVKIDMLKNTAVNATMGVNGQFETKFQLAERLPSSVTCGIHPWESGYLLVNDTPYFATTDLNGKFTIKNLPVGDWEFVAWQERVGYLAAKPEWKSGKFNFSIKKGENSLGELKIAPDLLAKKK